MPNIQHNKEIIEVLPTIILIYPYFWYVSAGKHDLGPCVLLNPLDSRILPSSSLWWQFLCVLVFGSSIYHDRNKVSPMLALIESWMYNFVLLPRGTLTMNQRQAWKKLCCSSSEPQFLWVLDFFHWRHSSQSSMRKDVTPLHLEKRILSFFQGYHRVRHTIAFSLVHGINVEFSMDAHNVVHFPK